MTKFFEWRGHKKKEKCIYSLQPCHKSFTFLLYLYYFISYIISTGTGLIYSASSVIMICNPIKADIQMPSCHVV